jgi:hypothetical protein
MLGFLKRTRNDCLVLRADDSDTVKWYVDAAFAVHPDYKSQTGIVATMGHGAFNSISRKQNVNTRSSTEAETVAVDDAAGPMLWTSRFLESLGYPTNTVLYQDNKSAILLEKNGRKSAGKRSRHMNIRYFFITDLKERGLIDIQYCPTDQMIGDYMTKPVHGEKFRQFRNTILNITNTHASQLMMLACVRDGAK